MHLIGRVIVAGQNGYLVEGETQRAVASSSGRTGTGGNVYAPPSSDVEGSFIVVGLRRQLATDERIDVQAVESGIQHGFTAASGARFDGSYRIYRAFDH